MIEKIDAIIAGEAPVFFMIAGPNGAGKSTYRKKRLDPAGLTCIDPDQIAIDILGRHPKDAQEAFELIKPLREGLSAMVKDPKHFKKFDDPNEWGTYNQFLSWLTDYLEACIDNPRAVISVSR